MPKRTELVLNWYQECHSYERREKYGFDTNIGHIRLFAHISQQKSHQCISDSEKYGFNSDISLFLFLVINITPFSSQPQSGGSVNRSHREYC